jgi:hypothetical protein
MNNGNINSSDDIATTENAAPNVAILNQDIGTTKVDFKPNNPNPSWEEIQAAQARLGIFGRGSGKARK